MQTTTSVAPLPFFYIGRSLTNSRIESYRNTKLGLLSEAIDKPDTENIWYSKDHLQKLIDEIDYVGGDGLRIYFGSYEASHEFANQTCLVMSITRQDVRDEAIKHPDVVLENEPEFEQRSSLPRDVVIYPGEEDQPFKRDFNYGSPCPPRCDPPPSGLDE
jgi:hypothetical protein